MAILENRYVQYLGILIVGIVLGYVLLPSKTITREVKVKEYVKGKIVKVEKPGITITTTDFTSDTTSDSYEKTEINKKRFSVQGSYLLGGEKKATQALVLFNVTDNLGIGTGIHYNITDKYAMGMITAQFNF